MGDPNPHPAVFSDQCKPLIQKLVVQDMRTSPFKTVKIGNLRVGQLAIFVYCQCV